MKKQLALILSFFFCMFVFAQKELSKDYEYTVSEPYQVYDAAKKYYFNVGGEILSIKPWKKYLMIQKFGVDGINLISEKKYEDLPDNYVVEGMVQLQDKFYFFYSSWSGRKTKHERLYYREINFETGEFISEPIKLIDVSGKLAGSPKSVYGSGDIFSGGFGFGFGIGGFGVVDKFDFLISKDESKLMVQYRKKPKVKRDTKSHDVIGFNTYDLNLSPIWSREYKMPYTERRMDILDFAVDANANGYLLAKVFHDDSNKDKKKKKDKEANYHMELFRLVDGAKDIKKTKIDLKDKFINGISLFESADDYMICAGFYNKGLKRKTLNNSDGLFTFKITRDGELVDEKSYEIPVEVLNQYVSNRAKKKNNKKDKKGKAEFANLELNDLIIKDDGGLVLIGEQSYRIIHRTQRSTYVTYHYNDMLISKIDASGNLIWMKKLPKRQTGKPKMGEVFDTSRTYQGGMSYSYFYTNNSHYLVFLDNVKNIDLPLNKKPALHSDGHGGYLTAYKISDETGDISKGNILDTRNVKGDFKVYQFSNNRVVKTAEDEFVIEFYKKKKEDVLIKVKIK